AAAAMGGYSSTRATPRRSRNVADRPQLSSRLSMAGARPSGEGGGARPSLRLLAPCPDVAPRCSDVILLLPAAMPALTIARPTQHSGSKSAFRSWHPGVD